MLRFTMGLALAACGEVEADDADDDDSEVAVDTTDATGTCDVRNEDCGPGTCGGEGSRMLPGSDCVACHTRSGGDHEAPAWTVGGTVFSDADGSSRLAEAIVRLTDADGKVVELTSNSVGNFWTSGSLRFPLQAEIERDGQVIAMGEPVPSGGCNACHACDGAAGGKLYAP